MPWVDDLSIEYDEFEYDSQKNENGARKNHIKFFDFSEYPPKYKFYHLNHALMGDTDSITLRIPDSLSECLPDDEDEIIGFCDDVGEESNKAFSEFIQKAFNCPTDRLYTITTERETVSDKSFFASKKRYAMHVIDDEGKRVDKMKIMGLEIKKSNTAKAVKDFLRKMVDMVLDGYTREQFLEEKEKFKEQFYQMTIAEISEPMPTTSMKKYMEAYEMTGSMKGFPYHVRAGMFYNSMCGPEDRKIFIGEKFYVCSINSLYSDYIGIPVDASVYPSFVDDIIINYDAMWKKADKKITNYMEALGWDKKSVADQKASDLFGV